MGQQPMPDQQVSCLAGDLADVETFQVRVRGVSVFGLASDPLFEISMEAGNALECSLIFSGILQIQYSLHAEGNRSLRRIKIPMNHALMLPVRLVLTLRRLEVRPVHTHPELLRAPDLRECLVDFRVLAIVP